ALALKLEPFPVHAARNIRREHEGCGDDRLCTRGKREAARGSRQKAAPAERLGSHGSPKAHRSTSSSLVAALRMRITTRCAMAAIEQASVMPVRARWRFEMPLTTS